MPVISCVAFWEDCLGSVFIVVLLGGNCLLCKTLRSEWRVMTHECVDKVIAPTNVGSHC